MIDRIIHIVSHSYCLISYRELPHHTSRWCEGKSLQGKIPNTKDSLVHHQYSLLSVCENKGKV